MHTETSTQFTWRSPDNRKGNQIDSIIMNGKWRRFLQDMRVCCGTDIYSNHYVVTACIKLKLQRVVLHSQRRKQLDVTRLTCPVTKQDFVLELRKRFSELAYTLGEFDHETNNKWDTIKKTYVEVAIKSWVTKRRTRRKS